MATSLIKAAPRLRRNLQTTFLEVLVQDLSIIKAAARLYQQIPTPKLSCNYREPPFYSLASRDRYRSCDNISFALQFTDVLRVFLKFIQNLIYTLHSFKKFSTLLLKSTLSILDQTSKLGHYRSRDHAVRKK